MCDRITDSMSDLSPFTCSQLAAMIGDTAYAEAARRETRERMKRELELNYQFFVVTPWRWTNRKMRNVAEDLADEYAEAGDEAHEALYEVVLETLRAYSNHPVTALDQT